MITKEQATYLMKLVHDVDDASAAMASLSRSAKRSMRSGPPVTGNSGPLLNL